MSELHILRPNNPRYLVRVRKPGHRKYECWGHLKDQDKAYRKLGSLMATGRYKRGDVLMVTNDYYEPSMLVEMVRQ